MPRSRWRLVVVDTLEEVRRDLSLPSAAVLKCGAALHADEFAHQNRGLQTPSYHLDSSVREFFRTAASAKAANLYDVRRASCGCFTECERRVERAPR